MKNRKLNFRIKILSSLNTKYVYQNNEEHAVARLVEALRYTTAIFHWHNPSGVTLCMESTQPPTEMRTKNISWGVNPVGA